MNEISYIGETLWPGQLGQILTTLAFTAALFSSIAFFYAVRSDNIELKRQWRVAGRWLFGLHGISVLGIIGLLFFLMIGKYYEYAYVFEHVSDDLPMRYILSAFWEGQEGSFLLWMFWHIVLGAILIFNKKPWEPAVLAVLALVEAFIASMLLGIYLPLGEEGLKLGSNPTLLLRQVMDAPIFQSADYLQLIEGRGLNILLQNYWMTIHPPTLFLGFASVTIPFAFAIGGMLTASHKTYLRAMMPWALFSAGILGLGILMGAAWAYEALTFGGYWAWDPVENMSLVPWLMLIGGVHTNLIARATGHSIRSTYLFYIAAFLLVLYSTYLTRSGVLGDTSVHAFTEMGLEAQLIGFIGFFLLGSAALAAFRWKQIPAPEREEATNSREFWMFIGAMVLIISSVLITYSTSLPVLNKIMQIFDPAYKGRVIEDPEAHYNRYQLWVGVLIGLLSGISVLMRYNGRNWSNYKSRFFRRTGLWAGVSLLITILMAFAIPKSVWPHWLLLFAASFTVLANGDYMIRYIKFNFKQSASSLSHIGFGLLMAGVLLSGLNKQYITYNPFVQRGLTENMGEEELLTNALLLKGEPLFLKGYEAEYRKDSMDGRERTFIVDFVKKEEGQTERFTVRPNIIYDKQLTKVEAYNPSIVRGLGRDVFTRIAGLPQQDVDRSMARAFDDSLDYQRHHTRIGDTIFTNKHWLSPVSLQPVRSLHEIDTEEGDQGLQMEIAVGDLETGETVTATPTLLLRGTLSFQFPEELDEMNMRIRLGDSVFLPYLNPLRFPSLDTFGIGAGESVRFDNYEIRMKGFLKEFEHPHYWPREGDIALAAALEVEDLTSGEVHEAMPVYFIRNSLEQQIDAFVAEENLSFRFRKLRPDSGTMLLQVGGSPDVGFSFPLYVAENVPTTDYISLEAIIFPGINLVWLGSVLMLFGFFLSWWNKRKLA